MSRAPGSAGGGGGVNGKSVGRGVIWPGSGGINVAVAGGVSVGTGVSLGDGSGDGEMGNMGAGTVGRSTGGAYVAVAVGSVRAHTASTTTPGALHAVSQPPRATVAASTMLQTCF